MATRQQICRIRVLAKNSPFLANSSTRQNGLFWKCVGLARLADIRQAVSRGLARLTDICRAVLRGLAKLADIRQTRRHLPSRVARTRQTRERRVWQVLCEFSESGKFGECRLDRFMHINYVICA